MHRRRSISWMPSIQSMRSISFFLIPFSLSGYLVIGGLLALGTGSAAAADPPSLAPESASADTAAVQPPEKPRAPRIHYGGSVGFSVGGDYTRLSIHPTVGYSFNPKLSAGVRVGYEYVNDRRGAVHREENNFGGSVFSRYHFIPQLSAQVEFEYVSYDFADGREWVPSLLLGGAYAQPLGGNLYFVAELLFDVIQDEHSPYNAGEPRINVGLSVGF